VADGGALTSAARLAHVEAVINPLAGSTGPTALAEMQDLLAGFGFKANVQAAQPADLSKVLQGAVDRAPDLLIVLAGDGTARAACELAGTDGPLVAPLPGGTMNLLPKALYGGRDWKTALTDSLTQGVVRDVSGGEIEGRRFYVGAMLGWPALMARVREAAREHHLTQAVRRARMVWRRAFTGHVHFSLDDGGPERAEALTFLCPLVSKRLKEDVALEVAALNPEGLKDVLRMSIRALAGDAFGDWREDPAVDLGVCRQARAWARGDLPAYLDGEPVKLSNHVRISFQPKAFRALAPATEEPATI
jgi:diacylglycerol kinase family enzyme